MISSCEDIGLPKPNTEVYRRCLEKLGGTQADLSRCVVFEDALVGLEGASELRKEGCYVVCINYNGEDADTKRGYADRVIRDFQHSE